MEILRRVHCQLGGRIYFAHQKHREAIGFAVIRSTYGSDEVQKAAAGVGQEHGSILVRERLNCSITDYTCSGAADRANALTLRRYNWAAPLRAAGASITAKPDPNSTIR